MTREEEAEVNRLLERVLSPGVDAATEAVLQAAMLAAVCVTHECGTPEATDRAVLDTYKQAIGVAFDHVGE